MSKFQIFLQKIKKKSGGINFGKITDFSKNRNKMGVSQEYIKIFKYKGIPFIKVLQKKSL